MHDIAEIAELTRDGLPSGSRLARATAMALLLATALLVTTVLPAEYGIDPTGLGKIMGLTALSSVAAAEPNNTAAAGLALQGSATGIADKPSGATRAPVWKSVAGYRADDMSLTLLPGQGAEIKAIMQAGEPLLFHWQVEGGAVSFDMHGERPKASDEFTSFWLGQNETRASGSFEAPFAGIHGWYWQNNGSEPVIVHLKTAGFYTGIYQP